MTALDLVLLCLLLAALGVGLASLWRTRGRGLPAAPPRPAAAERPLVPLDAYALAFQASRDGLYLLDERQRYVDVNQAWLDLLGCAREELIGYRFGTQAGDLSGAGDLTETSCVKVRRSDIPKTLEMSCVEILLEGKRYTLGRARDVTERQEYQARLERLQASVEASTDGLFVCTREGEVVYQNRAARPWLERGLAQVRWHLRQGQANARFEVRHGDGPSPRIGILQLNPTADGVVGCIRDETEARHSAEQRLLAERRLHEVQRLRSLGILAGRLAHDYNNLLTGIHGFAVLASECDDLDRIKRYLDKVLRSSAQAASLTRQLREFSSHKAGRFARVELGELVPDLKRSLRGVLGERVVLKVHLRRLAPVLGDEGQLRQLLLNLALRVREVMREDDRGQVSLVVDQCELGDEEAMARGLPHGGTFARIEFEDDLAPIVGEGLEVFEPFAGTGAGLGLPAAYGIVMRHGGAIQAAPSVGGGARFTIFLPVDESPAPEAQDDTRSYIPSPVTSGRVLVVDDEDIVLELAASVLRDIGFEVETATNGERALEMLRERPEHFDLLLCDVILPGRSGLEVVEEAKRITEKTRFLLMTGYTGSAPAADLPVVEKPFSPRSLLRRVQMTLEPSAPQRSSDAD
ncbi:MAG: response regulator [Planctomycetota bacterium]|nr:MAG: response regulator [Planctomycetota bacterium]